MIRHARLAAFCLALALTQLSALRAAGVLDHVPPDSLGFAVVRNLATTNDKAQRVTKIFESVAGIPIPAPLAFIKTATGLGEGLDESGDGLLALLPGDSDPLAPKMLLLAPVSNYAKFAESIGGDPSGEICRVTIVGEEVLVAKRGEYAMLMNVEHRPRMEAILAEAASSAPPVAPLSKWLETNDFAIVVLPAGVKVLTAAAQTQLAAQRKEMENQFSDPQFAEMMAGLKEQLEMYDAVLSYCNAEVSAAALGASIDDATNVRLSKRIVFDKQGDFGKIADTPKLQRSPLDNFAAAPFIFAGGGPLPPAMSEQMAKLSRQTMEQYRELYGAEKFDESQWAKIEESWRAAMSGMRSMSIAMLPGEDGDPLYSNLFFTFGVDAADVYLGSMKNSMEMWNDLTDASTSDIKIKYEMSDAEIEGKKGMLISADIAAAAADENVPMIKPMMEAMFGADGKMRIYTIAADPKTVVMGMGKEAQIAAAIKRATSGEAGLAQSPEVQTTTALLDPTAPWTGYVSPQGCVQWFKRMFAGIMGAFGGATFDIPAYPVGPPVGFAVNLTGGQLQGEMAVPVKTLEDLAAYIKLCQGL